MLDSKTDLKSLLNDPSLLAEKAYVDGKWVDSESGATFEVTNPARGDVIARFPLHYSWASLVAQVVKNLPAMSETWV